MTAPEKVMLIVHPERPVALELATKCAGGLVARGVKVVAPEEAPAGLDVPRTDVAEAIDLVASKRDGDGRWRLETRYPGRMPVEIDEGEGRPSRWITLRALRVLDWYSARD